MGAIKIEKRLSAQRLTKEAFEIVSKGLREEKEGKFDKAHQNFERALKLLDNAVNVDPTYSDAHNERAIVLTHLNRLDEAAEAARTAMRLEPQVAKYRMAVIGIGLKEVELQKSRDIRKRVADKYWDEVAQMIKMFPKYPGVYLTQALLQAMTGVGQSQWEASLSKAAKIYFGLKTMYSGQPATEKTVARAMKNNIVHCLELAREWDRLEFSHRQPQDGE